jgi:hypothetical protein
MHKSATKCNETIGKWCKNKHGASKIIDTLETYQSTASKIAKLSFSYMGKPHSRVPKALLKYRVLILHQYYDTTVAGIYLHEKMSTEVWQS